MLAEYKRKTNICVGVGIVLQIIGRLVVIRSGSGEVLLGSLVVLLGAGVLIWGCAQYATGKGHSPWFGALGLLSIIGLIILVFLPDRHKQAPA
jgi:hypothetical protein